MEQLVNNKKLFGREVDQALKVEVENNVEVRWSRLKDVVNKSAQKVIGLKIRAAARKSWVNNDIISKMNQRRKWENINTKEGRRNMSTYLNGNKHQTEPLNHRICIQ